MFDKLTPELLEENYGDFLWLLETKTYTNNVNEDGGYNCWYSPLLICLVMLTGKNEDDPQYLLNSNYGGKTSIPDVIAVKIFWLLIEHGADVFRENYYGENIFDFVEYEKFMKNKVLTKRSENELLLAAIKDLAGRSPAVLI